jgi:hypothetical protein
MRQVVLELVYLLICGKQFPKVRPLKVSSSEGCKTTCKDTAMKIRSNARRS